MTESDLKAQFILGVQSMGWWMEKFPDTAKGVVKPFDLVGCVAGHGISVEAKLTDIIRARPEDIADEDIAVRLSDFRRHQIPNLQKYQKAGGRGLALFGIHLTQRRAFRTTRARAWLLPVDWLVRKEAWRVGEIDPRCELLWAPGIGWRPKETLVAWCERRTILDARSGANLPDLR